MSDAQTLTALYGINNDIGDTNLHIAPKISKMVQCEQNTNTCDQETQKDLDTAKIESEIFNRMIKNKVNSMQ